MKVTTNFDKLRQLKDAMQKRITKKAVRAGVKLIIATVRSKVPTRTGSLKKSLSSKVDSAKGSTIVYGIIGPRSSWTKTVNGRLIKPSRYAHLVEKGKYRRPFLLPSWQSNKGTYLKKVQEVIADEIKSILG